MTYFRYIFREFFPPFIFSLSLIIFLFVMNLLFQMLGKIAGKGLPLGTIAEYFFLNLAWMVAMAVPIRLHCWAMIGSMLGSIGSIHGGTNMREA